MRPIAGGELFPGRSRKASITDNQALTALAGPGHGTQTTYFLTNNEPAAHSTSTLQPILDSKGSTYGVQSLEDTVSPAGKSNSEEAFGEDNQDQSAESSILMERKRSKRRISKSTTSEQEDSTLSTGHTSPSQQSHRRLSQNTISQPLTPLFLASPALGSSMPSSPVSTSTKSFRHSDEESIVDDAANQAVVFSGDDNSGAVSSELLDSAPQLIMPSIRMPSRRPFTDKGKNMGRLKVLIAGDSGVGKTSLIKSIVQVCEDIVHVDPLSPAMPSIQAARPKRSKPFGERSETTTTKQVTEVYASTRPYPAWWSDIDESKVLRRRKSMGDTVLERNLCFVDTPGYSNGTPFAESIGPVIRYMESQLERTASATDMNDGDTLGILSGNGGFHVDIIFYLISNNIKPVDIDFLLRLSPLCNIIPVIAKADLLSPDQLPSIKSTIMADLRDKSIQPFVFARTPGESLKATNSTLLFAVSSSTASDAEIMDASLLMSPDYVQPLLPSELAILVEQVFEAENIAWLRHAAAKKFIQWRKSLPSIPASQSPHSPLGMGRSSSAFLGNSTPSSNLNPHSTYSSSQIPVSYAAGNSSYALARVADHTYREERLAQVRLAKWAGDLQRSLQNERERYEALVKGERAVWLTERLGECVVDGSLVPVTSVQRDLALVGQVSAQGGPSSGLMVRPGVLSTRGHGLASLNPRDPLGLLRWKEGLRNKGWLAVHLLGSFGVIGALAVWFARSKGLNGETLGTWSWNWWGGGV